MIWNDDISFNGFQEKIDDWYKGKEFDVCGPPIDAQSALDLIFKTLIDDKEHYPFLTTFPESKEQINTIMLDLILTRYSKKYRIFKRRRKKMKDKKSDIFEQTLKNLADRGFEVSWLYESMTNSILIRLKKMDLNKQWYRNEYRIGLEDMGRYLGSDSLFDFNMAQFLKAMASEVDRILEKGEN